MEETQELLGINVRTSNPDTPCGGGPPTLQTKMWRGVALVGLDFFLIGGGFVAFNFRSKANYRKNGGTVRKIGEKN